MWKIQPGIGNDYVTKTFRLPRNVAESLETLAFQNNLSLNQLVIQSLRYALNNLDISDKKTSANNKLSAED